MLPLEILLQILDDDNLTRYDLFQFTLVNKVVNSVATRVLYNKLTLGFEFSQKKCCKRNSAASMLSLIQCLTLKYSFQKHNFSWDKFRVSKLTFDDCDIDRHERDQFLRLVPSLFKFLNFKFVTTFEWGPKATGISIFSLTAILKEFKYLKNLSLCNVEYNRKFNVTEELRVIFDNLVSLKVFTDKRTSQLSVFLLKLPLSKVKVLRIPVQNFTDFGKLAKYLENLTHLEMVNYHQCSSRDEELALVLSKAQNLSTFVYNSTRNFDVFLLKTLEMHSNLKSINFGNICLRKWRSFHKTLKDYFCSAKNLNFLQVKFLYDVLKEGDLKIFRYLQMLKELVIETTRNPYTETRLSITDHAINNLFLKLQTLQYFKFSDTYEMNRNKISVI